MKFKESTRHAQMPIYVVFHEECDFQVKTEQFWRPEAKKIEKLILLELSQNAVEHIFYYVLC